MFSLRSAVTLMLKSGGKHGATIPYTFTSAADFASYAATHDICIVSKDGVKKRGVLSLADVQLCEAGDYLLRTAPFDSFEEDVDNLKRAGMKTSGGLEQATTKAILTSASLIAEFGELCSIDYGPRVIFYDHCGRFRFGMGGVVVSSNVLILHEARQTPTLSDVRMQVLNKSLLKSILADPSAYRTSPRGCLEALSGITEIVPVISGYNVRPEVEAACKAAGVRCVKVDGCDYSSAS